MQDSFGYGNKQKYRERTVKRQVPDHRQEGHAAVKIYQVKEPGSRQLLCELHPTYWTATT